MSSFVYGGNDPAAEDILYICFSSAKEEVIDSEVEETFFHTTVTVEAPKDANLYQVQKALDNAKHAVKKGRNDYSYWCLSGGTGK